MQDVVVNQVYSVASHNFGFWSMFASATFVVKCVIIILFGLSILSWAIIIQKGLLLRSYSKVNKEFYSMFWKSDTVGKIYKQVSSKKDLYSKLFVLVFNEYHNISKLGIGTSTFCTEMRESIDRLFRLESFKVYTVMENNLDFLASIGSATPFIGLLGTVWGIMDSFEQIGLTKNANLAVVAPGIAEALFTTALGLIVTIPAVIGYNKVRDSVRHHMGQLENYSDQLKDLFAKSGSSNA